MDLGAEEGREDLGGAGRRGNHNQNILYGKKLFSTKRIYYFSYLR